MAMAPVAAAAAPTALAATKAALIKYAPALLNMAGPMFGNKNQQANRDAQYDAMNSYLEQMNAKRKEAKNYMEGNQQTGEKQFMTEANQALPEIGQVKQDIRQGATEQQQEARNQMMQQLAAQGVRGGQASTLLNRGTGQIARESLRDENTLGMQEALGRQQARLGYTAQKGLIPYGTLNTAQWLHMPSDTEKQLMASAINSKFGG